MVLKTKKNGLRRLLGGLELKSNVGERSKFQEFIEKRVFEEMKMDKIKTLAESYYNHIPKNSKIKSLSLHTGHENKKGGDRKIKVHYTHDGREFCSSFNYRRKGPFTEQEFEFKANFLI